MGVPEVVEYNETKLMGREAVAIQKQTGWTPEKLARAMEGKVVRDENNELQYQVDATGEQVLDDNQQPIPLREIDAEALLIMAWIAVRRSSPAVTYADFDLDLFATKFGDDDEPAEGDSGKS